jgi:hypothetical protein
LTDWPGLRNSALPRISQPVASLALRSRISGVLPTASARSVYEGAGAELLDHQHPVARRIVGQHGHGIAR